MEDWDLSFVSNTNATICNTADLCSAWGLSLISDPNIPASSSTSVGNYHQQQISTASDGCTDQDLIESAASSTRSFMPNGWRNEKEIRIFNVDFSQLYGEKRSEIDINNRSFEHITKNPVQRSNSSGTNANDARQQQPQPQPNLVYNNNDLRRIVQRLNGSPSQKLQPGLPQYPPQPRRSELQGPRPAPLVIINRPRIPMPVPVQPSYNNNSQKPHQQYDQPSTVAPGGVLANAPESPISAYIRYLQQYGQPSNVAPGGVLANAPSTVAPGDVLANAPSTVAPGDVLANAPTVAPGDVLTNAPTVAPGDVLANAPSIVAPGDVHESPIRAYMCYLQQYGQSSTVAPGDGLANAPSTVAPGDVLANAPTVAPADVLANAPSTVAPGYVLASAYESPISAYMLYLQNSLK